MNICKNFSNYKIKTIITNNQKQDYDLFGGKVYADITNAKKILNWKPKYFLEEGLKKTYDWYQKNISLYD